MAGLVRHDNDRMPASLWYARHHLVLLASAFIVLFISKDGLHHGDKRVPTALNPWGRMVNEEKGRYLLRAAQQLLNVFRASPMPEYLLQPFAVGISVETVKHRVFRIVHGDTAQPALQPCASCGGTSGTHYVMSCQRLRELECQSLPRAAAYPAGSSGWTLRVHAHVEVLTDHRCYHSTIVTTRSSFLIVLVFITCPAGDLALVATRALSSASRSAGGMAAKNWVASADIIL